MKPIELPPGTDATLFTGVPPAAYGAWLASMLEKSPGPWVILGPNMGALEALAQDFRAHQTLTHAKNPLQPYFFPEAAQEDALPKQRFEIDCDRLTALSKLLEISSKAWSTTPCILFSTPAAVVGACPTTQTLGTKKITLLKGKSIDFESLKVSLNTDLGYDHEVLCEAPGQYAIRGGLIDIYPPNADRPYRVDLFGNEIESIRPFDPSTQRSSGNSISQLTLAPLLYSANSVQTAAFWNYLKGPVRWVVPWSTTLAMEAPKHLKAPTTIDLPYATLKDLIDARSTDQRDAWYGLTELDTGESGLFGKTAARVELTFESLEPYRPGVHTDLGLERMEIEREQRERFLNQVLQWQQSGHKVIFACNNKGELKRLQEYLEENPKLNALLKADFSQVNLREGLRVYWGQEPCPLSWSFLEGFIGFVVLTDAEIFGRYRNTVPKQKRRSEAQHKAVDQLLDFSELVDGDHLVHLQHGICRYRGLQDINVRGSRETVISLEFEDSVLLHLPLHESHLVTRYVGFQKASPRLAKLGGNTWEKTKRAAEKASFDFAAKLLQVQAQRADEPGFAFSEDYPWQQSFEAAFLHTETPDQLKAIQAVKADMESSEPMDRLLCGDVGFGKTEVALRAAFKAVMDGKQVAVLVPTTVLCQQHFNTFRERLADYPVSVEMLSRFRTPKQQKAITEALKKGKVDVLIGTHRLLSKDITFKDLGLLIIDEEHRFGVRHKEQIKELKAHVDVLAMSATPIPRSLYMALVGARDLSVIETPPNDRLPIQTIVKGYDLKLVEQAVRYEIERGGQVFYLHNRVSTIEAVAQRLEELIPDLKVAVGHGQMSETQLERVMTQFVEGKHDVLVSTTIIESGLDIPNCNTLIIESADRFGLAQLYQIRGRVGRFNRQAYAYLLLHRHARVVEHAHKRLSALRQHNQLGAGYRIAMRDLELRGAGNILGKEQSGHIAGVGFDLYCQLLRQSIARLKSQDPLAGLIRCHVRLDFVHLGEGIRTEKDSSHENDFKALKSKELEAFKSEIIDACIPETYVGETRLRIDTYRQLAMAGSRSEVESIEQALEDRFGPLPPNVQALIWLSKIRCAAEKKEFVGIETEGNQLKCQCLRSSRGNFLKRGGRFPRLTQQDPFLKLQEILKFIENHRVV
ncbi:MAG: hypothetical protein Tsb0018_02120 [Opitutales bacterium]